MKWLDRVLSNQRKSRLPLKAELQRKSIHVLMALVLLVLHQTCSRSFIVGLMVTLSILAGLFEWLRIQANPLAIRLQQQFAFLMRPMELESSVNRIHLIGATWVLWSLALLTWLFPMNMVISCYAMFLIADGMAAIFGKWLGTHNWPNSKKTFEGSLAFFLSGLATLAFFQANLLVACIAVLLAALAEIPEKPFDDNFRVPLVATTVYFVAERLLG